jgi:hypothetical protein
MAVRNLSDADLSTRLDIIERLMHRADAKDLPSLTAAFGKLLDEQVRRDLEKEDMEPDCPVCGTELTPTTEGPLPS